MERIVIPIDKDWLSASDVADYMQVSTYVITELLRAGELRGVKVGRQWRVARIDLEDWLNRQRGVEP